MGRDAVGPVPNITEANPPEPPLSISVLVGSCNPAPGVSLTNIYSVNELGRVKIFAPTDTIVFNASAALDGSFQGDFLAWSQSVPPCQGCGIAASKNEAEFSALL